ncbi:MAG: GDYXXLXY domain-containing protein [Burkholderiales bacterium]|nr:GDYXXLXY domain-containing protein [Burkholderiales bacterium]
MRKLIAVLAGVIVLCVVNFNIYQREQLLTHGRVVLLELAPVDPRSLMQGDYMALNYKVANEAFPRGNWKELKDGHLVVALDEKGVGNFKRLADGAPQAANEALLRYRIRDSRPKFATNAFFFQEGHAKVYEAARYGEFRVAASGDMILTAMRGADFKVLGVAN